MKTIGYLTTNGIGYHATKHVRSLLDVVHTLPTREPHTSFEATFEAKVSKGACLCLIFTSRGWIVSGDFTTWYNGNWQSARHLFVRACGENLRGMKQ